MLSPTLLQPRQVETVFRPFQQPPPPVVDFLRATQDVVSGFDAYTIAQFLTSAACQAKPLRQQRLLEIIATCSHSTPLVNAISLLHLRLTHPDQAHIAAAHTLVPAIKFVISLIDHNGPIHQSPRTVNDVKRDISLLAANHRRRIALAINNYAMVPRSDRSRYIDQITDHINARNQALLRLPPLFAAAVHRPYTPMTNLQLIRRWQASTHFLNTDPDSAQPLPHSRQIDQQVALFIESCLNKRCNAAVDQPRDRHFHIDAANLWHQMGLAANRNHRSNGNTS